MENIDQKNHPYHIVDPSPWPIFVSFSLFFIMLFGVLLMHEYSYARIFFYSGLLLFSYSLFSWFKDILFESKIPNTHNRIVANGLRIGMYLFILTEIVFFLGLFASFAYAWMFSFEITELFNKIGEYIWPPSNIKKIDPWDIPFINTLILLLSGTSLSFAHYGVIYDKQKPIKDGLLITILLGIIFLLFQAYEYHHASFSLTDGVYSANFYLLTSFHGLHVLIGVIFLIICYMRALKKDFGNKAHIGFEFAALYWHFVDVVWILLFIFVYLIA